eukprot:gene13896-18633_t
MQLLLQLAFLFSLTIYTISFTVGKSANSLQYGKFFSSTSLSSTRKRKGNEVAEIAPRFVVGEDVPEEILKQAAIYDMILVERFSQPETTSFGLFLPKMEGKDQKHLGQVISLPKGHGLESELGYIAPIEIISPFKVGDIVYIKDPWGIGPKDQEFGPRCFSFHKAAHITGVVRSA